MEVNIKRAYESPSEMTAIASSLTGFGPGVFRKRRRR